MSPKPRIAIHAPYPVWLLGGSPVPPFQGLYATWLVALSEAFCSHQDFDIHWLNFNKAARRPVRLEHIGQHFHILPRLRQIIGQFSRYLHERLADTGPIIVKEARVMGVSSVLSNSCDSKQHVAGTKSGFVHDAHDAYAFVRAVLVVTQDVATSLRMGAHSMQECSRPLSEETMYNTIRTYI